MTGVQTCALPIWADLQTTYALADLTTALDIAHCDFLTLDALDVTRVGEGMLLWSTQRPLTEMEAILAQWWTDSPQLHCMVVNPLLADFSLSHPSVTHHSDQLLCLSRLPRVRELQQWWTLFIKNKPITPQMAPHVWPCQHSTCAGEVLNALFCVVKFDHHHQIVFANQRVQKEMGWSAKQLLHRSIDEIVLWSHEDTSVVQYFEHFEGETRYFHASGEQRWALAKVYRQAPAHQSPVYYWVATDITEQKKHDFSKEYAHYQEGLLRAKKELVHDLGNTLNSMNATQSQIKQGVEQLSETTHLITQWLQKLESPTADLTITKVIEFVQAVNHSLIQTREHYFDQNNLALARDLLGLMETLNTKQADITQQASVSMPSDLVNVYNLLTELIQSCQALFDQKQITVRYHACELDKTCFLKVSRSQLFQALMNLVKNAVDALEISQKPQKKITLSTHRAPGYLVIEIHDTAEGIAKQHLSQIYNYGFTTKMQGTGQGLPSVANLVNALQGKIEVQSSYETGTCFRVLLPLRLQASTPQKTT